MVTVEGGNLETTRVRTPGRSGAALIGAKDRNDTTALHLAAANGHNPVFELLPLLRPTSIPRPYFTSVLNPFQPPFPPLSLPPQCRACGREERGKQEKRQPTVRYRFLGRRNHTARSPRHLNTPPSYHYNTSPTFHLARALVCSRADHVFLPGSAARLIPPYFYLSSETTYPRCQASTFPCAPYSMSWRFSLLTLTNSEQSHG